MADYQKMYSILCAAIDEVIDPLERIPLARSEALKLRSALLTAEDVYIATAPLAEEDGQLHIVPCREKE